MFVLLQATKDLGERSLQATAVNKLLTRAKRIITRNNPTELSNSDYNLFCISDFNNIVFLAVVCQFHRCMYGDLQCRDFNKLSQVHATRASILMKCVTDRNRKCCDNSIKFAAPKLYGIGYPTVLPAFLILIFFMFLQSSIFLSNCCLNFLHLNCNYITLLI